MTATEHTPISMDSNGVVTNRDGKQVAAMMPGEMRVFGAEIVKVVNASDALVAEVDMLTSALWRAYILLAALVRAPSNTSEADWPCDNPSDRECLQEAFNAIRKALPPKPLHPTA